MLRSPTGLGPDASIFETMVKDHDPMEALPLRFLVRKMLCMRLALCRRRMNVLLQTHQGRRQALIGLGLIIFLICSAVTVARLPDSNDEARQMNRGLTGAFRFRTGAHASHVAPAHPGERAL